MTNPLIDKMQKMMEKAIENGITQSIEDISDQSLKETPIDSGDLRKSYKVEVNNREIGHGSSNGQYTGSKVKFSEDMEIKMSYNTDYALKQHEYYPHKRVSGTKTKYLQDPILHNIKNIPKNIGKNIK